jgi:hypothetical protein
MIVTSNKPVGYSCTFNNNPLKASDTFFLFKDVGDKQPINNAMYLASLNSKVRWRDLWCDAICLKHRDYVKSKAEVRQRTTENKAAVEDTAGEAWTLQDGTELGWIEAKVRAYGKTRALHLRKEQLSQGVLAHMMKSLARLTIEQVTTARKNNRTNDQIITHTPLHTRTPSSSSTHSAALALQAWLHFVPGATSLGRTPTQWQWSVRCSFTLILLLIRFVFFRHPSSSIRHQLPIL